MYEVTVVHRGLYEGFDHRPMDIRTGLYWNLLAGKLLPGLMSPASLGGSERIPSTKPLYETGMYNPYCIAISL